MKVLYICNRGETGGATKSLLNLVLQLSKMGVEPYVLTPNKHGYVMNFCKKNNIKCFYIKYYEIGYALNTSFLKKWIKILLYPFFWIMNVVFNQFQVAKIKQIIPIKEIDIIHTNVNRDNYGILLSKKYKIPNIMHLREFGTLDFECYYLRHNIYKYYNNSVDLFIAISKSIERFYIQKEIPNNKIITIYNGVDRDSIISKKYTKMITDTFKIVMVGGISENKGQVQVVEALKLMSDRERKNIVVDFYGTGDNKYIIKLKEKIKKYNLNSNFCFKGYKKNINEIISKYDIAIMASKSEAFGRVTIEYMMANIAVIASNTGANPELIDNQKNGLLYNYNDYEDLKNKIVLLKNNKEMRKEIAENGCESSKKYTAEINASSIYNLYKEVFDENKNK